MKENIHLYHQALILFYFGIAFSLLPVAFACYNLYKIWNKQFYFGTGTSKEQRLPISLAAFGIAIAIVIASANRFNEAKRIRADFGEAIGTTVKIDDRDKSGCYHFKFIVNRKVHYGIDCDATQLKDVKSSGGHYQVVYNAKNPDEAVMDFDNVVKDDEQAANTR